MSDATLENKALVQKLMVELAYCLHADLSVSEIAKRVAAAAIQDKRTLQATLDEREKAFSEAAAAIILHPEGPSLWKLCKEKLSPFIQTPTDPLVEKVRDVFSVLVPLLPNCRDGETQADAMTREFMSEADARGLAIVAKEKS